MAPALNPHLAEEEVAAEEEVVGLDIFQHKWC